MSIRTRIQAGIVVLLVFGVLLATAASVGAFERLTFEPASFSPFGSFSHPTGVAVDTTTGEVFLADAAAVDIFGMEGGASLNTLTGTGSESFSFEGEPVGVAVDNDSTSASFHDIYITDVKHNVVDKFGRTGLGTYGYLCQIGGWYGTGEEACHSSGGAPVEAFDEPVGVAVDSKGNVYITGYGPGSGVVDEFDDVGKGVINIRASEHPQLAEHPQGIAVTSAGDLFIQNYGNERHVVELKRGSLTGGVEAEMGITSSASSIAIDLSSDDLLVDHGGSVAFYQLKTSGEPEFAGEFGGGVLSNSLGVGVNEATHTAYVSDANNLSISAFVPRPIVLPDLRGVCGGSKVTSSTAELSGEFDPLNTEGAQYTFEYGLTTVYEQQAGGIVEGAGFKAVSAEISGLIPGETYHCRINATNTEGLAHGLFNDGPDGTFETLPLAPVVDVPPAFATEVTATGAILNGEVNPGNGPTTYHFAYGLQAHTYTTALPDVGIGTGLTSIPVEQAIPSASLTPNTTYHFALIASNAAGTVTGPDETFTTSSNGTPPETPPVVSTGPAEAIAQNTATLTGTAYPENTPTICRFQLGIDTTYGTLIFTGEAGRERGAVHVSQPVASLQPGTTYHYRLECFNAAGTTIGPDRSFTTGTFPQEIFQPATPALVPIPIFPKVKNPVIKHPKKKKKPKKKRHKAKGARSRARRSAHGST